MLNGQATKNTHMCTHEPVEIKGFVTENAISKSQTTKWHPQHQRWALFEFLFLDSQGLEQGQAWELILLSRLKSPTKATSSVKLFCPLTRAPRNLVHL